MQPFLIALQFLTRIPVRLSAMPSPEALGRSLVWYPAVGLLIGLGLLAVHSLLHSATPALQAVLVLTFWVLITGGLHLDGLADSADAWAGGFGDRERTLLLMKDPHSGPMAVVVLVLLLLVKFSSLQQSSALALILAPWIARGLLPLLFLSTPYVRAQGLGSALSTDLPRPLLVFGLGVHLLGILSIGGYTACIAVSWALIGFLILRYLMQQRIGGTTGDTAGALVELSEAGILLGLALVQP